MLIYAHISFPELTIGNILRSVGVDHSFAGIPKKDCVEISDICKIALTSFSSFVVFVAGLLLSKWFIEPYYELRKVFGEVRFNLVFHAPTILTPIGLNKEKCDAAREALLKNSCDLLAKLHAVPFYCHRKAVEDAAKNLRGLSTHMYENRENSDDSLEAIKSRVTKIETQLGLKSLE